MFATLSVQRRKGSVRASRPKQLLFFWLIVLYVIVGLAISSIVLSSIAYVNGRTPLKPFPGDSTTLNNNNDNNEVVVSGSFTIPAVVDGIFPSQLVTSVYDVVFTDEPTLTVLVQDELMNQSCTHSVPRKTNTFFDVLVLSCEDVGHNLNENSAIKYFFTTESVVDRPALAFVTTGNQVKYLYSNNSRGSAWNAAVTVFSDTNVDRVCLSKLSSGLPYIISLNGADEKAYCHLSSDVSFNSLPITSVEIDLSPLGASGDLLACQLVSDVPSFVYQATLGGGTGLDFYRALNESGVAWPSSGVNLFVTGDNVGGVSMRVVQGHPAVAGLSSTVYYARSTSTTGSSWPGVETVVDIPFNDGVIRNLVLLDVTLTSGEVRPIVFWVEGGGVAQIFYKVSDDVLGSSWSASRQQLVVNSFEHKYFSAVVLSNGEVGVTYVEDDKQYWVVLSSSLTLSTPILIGFENHVPPLGVINNDRLPGVFFSKAGNAKFYVQSLDNTFVNNFSASYQSSGAV